MTKQTIIELEESLRQAHQYQDFYEELLSDCLVLDDRWQRIIDIQEKHQEIEARLPNLSDGEFDEYIILGDMLAALLDIPRDTSTNAVS